ncbi:MAG: LURP-one-related family protein [Planctomycetota bacterium]|nr:LURP-one-related family protein [Planctomycetota bacterium]
MRYVMKEKILSWGDDFTIRDSEERDVYRVKGKVFSLGDKLSFQNASGQQLAFIAQRLLAWGPTYEIQRGEEVLAVVKKKLFTFFKCQFTVDVPGPDDLMAQGDLLGHEYEFTRHGETVARVSKNWFTWSDTYGIDINDGEDEVLILCSAVVIDMACHEPNHHSD